MLARPDVDAFLDRCERLAHERGLTGHDVFYGPRDWLAEQINLRAIEDGNTQPTSDELKVLHTALNETYGFAAGSDARYDA